MLVINGKNDVGIKCVWCGNEFTLCKKEIWKDAYKCPSCKKLMGIPKEERGSLTKRKDGKEYTIDIVHVSVYQFDAHMMKGRIVPFLSNLVEEKNGYCTGISKFGNKTDRVPWIVHCEVKKAFEMEGVEWKLPPRFYGV